MDLTEGALTLAAVRDYHPYTIMADVNISRCVRLISAAALGLVLAWSAGAAPQSHGMPRSERNESRHEIDQAEMSWRDALIHRNVSSLEGLLAEDYIAITPNGTLQSKEQTLANLRSGVLQIKSMDFSDRKVRFYGQTALVTSRAELIGTNGDSDYSGSYRYTRVYVRNSVGKWKIVSFEASRIRDNDEHR